MLQKDTQQGKKKKNPGREERKNTNPEMQHKSRDAVFIPVKWNHHCRKNSACKRGIFLKKSASRVWREYS